MLAASAVARLARAVAAALVPFVLWGCVPPDDAPRPPAQRDGAPGHDLPADAVFKEAVNEDADRPRFDDFSWLEFVALNWPAMKDRRGEPDTKKALGADAEFVVWGSWKSLDELFPPDPKNTPPTDWQCFDAELNVLRPAKGLVRDAGKRKILGQVSRLSAVAQAGFDAEKLPPLIAQNGTYVRYEIRVNRVAYEFIRKNRYYLREVLDRVTTESDKYRIAFPDGSIVVKAAWMELTATDPGDRFYRVPAELEEWAQGATAPQLRKTTVGLVGLHIAHKTPQRPSWIWSTFEHVDNTEPGPGARRASFSKNDPRTVYANNVDYMPLVPDDHKPLPNQKPVDVQRAAPVNAATLTASARYHESRDVKGTVWQNYRLIATQWFGDPDPGDPGLGLRPENRARVFPKQATNATIETYRQTESCIKCHQTAPQFRYMFFPSQRAFPPPK